MTVPAPRAAVRVAPRERLLVRDIGGEIVILDLDSGHYFGLDEVGTHMWSALTASESFEDALRRLEPEFDVDRDTLERDLWGLVDRLRALALVEVVDLD